MPKILMWIAQRMPWRVLYYTRFGVWFQTRLLYRYCCPRPIIDDISARACVLAGCCGCDNQERYDPVKRALISGEPTK